MLRNPIGRVTVCHLPRAEIASRPAAVRLSHRVTKRAGSGQERVLMAFHLRTMTENVTTKVANPLTLQRKAADDPAFLLTNVDGERHRKLRSDVQPGFTRGAYEEQLASVVEVLESYLDGLSPGAPQDATDLSKRLIFLQMADVCLGVQPDSYFDDVNTVTDGLVRTVTKPWENYLPTPLQFRRSLRRLGQLWDLVSAGPAAASRRWPQISRRLAGEYGKSRTGAALLLAMPLVSGLDTLGSSLSFMLYTLARNSDVQDQIASEVRDTVGSTPLTAAALREMVLLRAAMLESFRLYPVVPGVMRYAPAAVEVGGFQIQKGEKVFLPFVLPHHLDAYYPEPGRFRPERFLERAASIAPPGTFAPFGIGAHACVGSGISEACFQTTIATVLRRYRVELDPPHYGLDVRWKPSAVPEGLRIRMQLRG